MRNFTHCDSKGYLSQRFLETSQNNVRSLSSVPRRVSLPCIRIVRLVVSSGLCSSRRDLIKYPAKFFSPPLYSTTTESDALFQPRGTNERIFRHAARFVPPSPSGMRANSLLPPIALPWNFVLFHRTQKREPSVVRNIPSAFLPRSIST